MSDSDPWFAQREGHEALPRQLNLKEISKELRAHVWKIYFDMFQEAKRSNYHTAWIDKGDEITELLYDFWIIRLHNPADEFSNNYADQLNRLKRIIMEGGYIPFLDFLEFTLRSPRVHRHRKGLIAAALENARAAYRIIENRVMPIATPEEGEALQRAFTDLQGANMAGPRAHLLNAGSSVVGGRFAESVRESIHAVEAAARLLEPSANTLEPALAKLARSGKIHGALKSGFASLYGFTSDEQGIRHALLEKAEADVDETDALFMLGACAAFVSYLVSRSRGA